MRQVLAVLLPAVMVAVTTISNAAESATTGSAIITLINEIEVSAEERGVLASIDVREGDVVDEGTVLAKLRDDESQLAVTHAELHLEAAVKEAQNHVKRDLAEKTREVAEAELRRANESVETFSRAVSETELDRLRLTVERSTLEIDQAEFEMGQADLTARIRENELKTARHELQLRHIRAPLSGMVVRIRHEAGEWVKPGDSIMRIIQLNRLRAETFLSANDADQSLVGRPVRVSIGRGDEPVQVFEGFVTFVSPEIDVSTREVRVWAEIENRDLLLRPGQKAMIEVNPVPPSSEAERDSNGNASSTES